MVQGVSLFLQFDPKFPIRNRNLEKSKITLIFAYQQKQQENKKQLKIENYGEYGKEFQHRASN